MNKGTRVVTPLGAGTVAYVRMGPPTYATPQAVSVVLDARRNDLNYSGTIFPAVDVKEENTVEATTEEINQLMVEAGAAGDREQVAICREALYGSGEAQQSAVAKCAEVLNEPKE